MGHEYVKAFETFNTARNGTVPKPTPADVANNKVLRADGAWVAQSGGGGGSSILLTNPIYSYHGGHHNGSGIRFSYNNIQESPFPNGDSAFTAEVFYNAFSRNANIDPYIISIGWGEFHQAFGIAIKRIVTYGDDFYVFGDEAYGIHHKVITYDGNVTIKIYMDGTLVESHTISSILNLNPRSIGIGCWLDGNEPLYGDIYCVKFYPSEFSAAEALALYNQRGL